MSTVGLLGLTALLGCATNTTALEEELSRLRREVQSLTQKISDNDLKIERLEGRVTLLALGESGEVAPAPKTPVVGATEPEEGPKNPPLSRAKVEQPKISQLAGPGRSLPVVKYGSDDEARYDGGALDDGSPPIEIQVVGAAEDDLPVDHQVLEKPDPVLDAPRKPSDRGDTTPPSFTPPARKSKVRPIEESEASDPPSSKKGAKAVIQAAYKIALAKLRIDGDAEAARKLFQRFAREYPTSEYADNVAYWTAECDFAQRRYEDAAKSFQKMIAAFPRSAKVPDAMLRQAEARNILAQSERAEVLLAKVIAQYPSSEAAKKAKALLQGAGGRR